MGAGAGAQPAAADPEIVETLLRGNKIDAIKLYRRRHPGADLATAKREVERIERTLPPGSIPKGRGCGTAALFVLAMIAAGCAIALGQPSGAKGHSLVVAGDRGGVSPETATPEHSSRP